ncbi:MAG: alpha/beta fold hydrolase [Pseudomonadota bacterium]
MEQAIRFGRSDHLTGVLSTPASDHSKVQHPIIVIPNAGFVHHVGPFRLHTYLARALREAGLSSFRFDLSGLGDSASPGGRQQVSERKNADLVDAMDMLSDRIGCTDFFMVGLCSGASDGHRVALVDSRVAGVVMIDPPAYPNRWFFVRKALNPFRVVRVFARTIRQRTRLSSVAESEPAAQPIRIHKPLPADEFASQLEHNVVRGVRYLFIYLNRQDYNHRSQLYSLLTPDTPRQSIQVIYERKFDHTLIFKADRVRVAEHVVNWALNLLTTHAGREVA